MIVFQITFAIAAYGQSQAAILYASDTTLQNTYNWAKAMALHYQGNPNDPVGPWYEAALPSREAFCIRDVSHQCIGAAILGMHSENKNMLTKFITNISASKDWCSFWEIDKWNKPAPADYKSDAAFWYNLNANFELVYACERLYRWTGDASYISSPPAVSFFEKTTHDYISKWKLEPDSLLTRTAMPNLPDSYDKTDNYTRSRGLPSYVESVDGLKMSVDLVAAIYRGFMAYSTILKMNGASKQSKYYAQQASAYYRNIESKWWNKANDTFYTYYTEDGQFHKGEGALFLLWFDALNDSLKRKAVIEQVTNSEMNVETMSYLPYLLYKNGYDSLARKYLLKLSNPATPRREYPEVSFAVIEGIVQGLMGIEPDAYYNTIRTCYRGANHTRIKIDSLAVLGSVVSIEHQGKTKSVFTNKGAKTITWMACFRTNSNKVYVNNKLIKAKTGIGADGKSISYVLIPVPYGHSVAARVK